MPLYLATNATFVVSALILAASGSGLTGQAANIQLWIRRTSDGFYLDFADYVFKASGWTTRLQPMTEASATNAPGLYTYPFDTSLIFEPVRDDTYQLFVDQYNANNAANVPQFEEVLMGRHLDVIVANLDVAVSTRAEPGDEMSLPPSIIALIQTVDPIEVAAAVWNTADGAGTGTMGRALTLLRRRQTNRRKIAADGTVTFYADNGTVEKTVSLIDVNAAAVVVQPGDPAESSAEGYP